MSTPLGPYTPIVRTGDWLIVSGQVGLADGALIGGGLAAELEQAFDNLEDLLASEGATLSDVVKTTMFLLDIGAYAEMNEIYMRRFGDHRPARSAVAVAALPAGASIEMEVWARIEGD